MKKFIILFVLLILVIACNSCKSSSTNQENFFGVGDVLVYEDTTRNDIDKRVSIMKQMGIKSHRFWIRAGRSDYEDNGYALFRIENNQLVVNDEYYQNTLYAINKLREAGIYEITLNISWLYGKEDGTYVYYGGNMPSPNDTRYEEFLTVVYEMYNKIALLYSDIPYIEMGNEYNGNFLSFDFSTRYPLELKNQFILDFSYYASKGIHDANPNIKSVLNGVLDIEYAPIDETGKRLYESHGTICLTRFFDDLYTKIESGTYPSIGVDKSTNPDDYFEIIAYHPYELRSLDEWIDGNNKIYEVIKNHNDGDKPIFITEWGIEQINGIGGKVYREIIDNKEKTPYIKQVHYYILSDQVDFSLYCLVAKDVNGNYYLTDSGKMLCPSLILEN